MATAEREGPTDVELLADVARGDRHAFATLHRRYGPILLGLLARILGSREEAEDVLQEVFVQLWRKAERYDPSKGRAFTWIVTLARNRGLDRLSVLAARHKLGAAPSNYSPPDDPPDPFEAARVSEDALRIRDALARISPAQRDVLLLAYFGGLSQSEIATQLASPLGTVKSHARLGLEKLRSLLGSNGAKGDTRK